MFQQTGAYNEFFGDLMGSLEQLSKSFANACGVLTQPDTTAAQWQAACDQIHSALTALYTHGPAKMVHFPVLGIGRESRQRLAEAVDAYSRMLLAMTDLSQRFGLPLKQTMMAFESQYPSDQANPTDPQTLFDQWMGLLETHCDQHLKSDQGIRSVGVCIQAYLDFQEKWNKVLNDLKKELGLPTRDEMSDIYREIMGLKRQVRHQQQTMTDQAQAIADLKKRMAQSSIPD